MSKEIIKRLFQLGGIEVKRYNPSLDSYKKLYDRYKEFTMIPEELFITNLELGSKFLDVPGDIVECGVWRGGMIAGLSCLSDPEKKIHLFDSFEGLPPAKEIDGAEAIQWQSDKESSLYYNNCAAEESFAIEVMKSTGRNFRTYKGWFEDTLASYEGNRISILRLDGDWYDSIKVCLNKLFPLVSEGGLIILDDYHSWDGCTKAVHDYLSEKKSPSRIGQWNNQVAYIVKKS